MSVNKVQKHENVSAMKTYAKTVETDKKTGENANDLQDDKELESLTW